MQFINNATTDDFQKFVLGVNRHLIISNDSISNYMVFSLNGQSVDGVLYPQETIELLDSWINEIFVKSLNTGASCAFRLFAYGSDRSPQFQELQNNNDYKKVNLNSYGG